MVEGERGKKREEKKLQFTQKHKSLLIFDELLR